jgi:hypothetical protein
MRNADWAILTTLLCVAAFSAGEITGAMILHRESDTSATIGEVCHNLVATSDETYLRDNMTCVEMHTAEAGDIKGWTVVDVVGTRQQAIFQNNSDALVWARSQPYVRPKWQVR